MFCLLGKGVKLNHHMIAQQQLQEAERRGTPPMHKQCLQGGLKRSSLSRHNLEKPPEVSYTPKSAKTCLERKETLTSDSWRLVQEIMDSIKYSILYTLVCKWKIKQVAREDLGVRLGRHLLERALLQVKRPRDLRVPTQIPRD